MKVTLKEDPTNSTAPAGGNDTSAALQEHRRAGMHVSGPVSSRAQPGVALYMPQQTGHDSQGEE